MGKDKDKDKFGAGDRQGHFMFTPNKWFRPKGNSKWYLYNRANVPSIQAGERIHGMFAQRPGPYKNRMVPTFKDVINTQAGDSDYFNKLLDHYDSLSEGAWALSNSRYDRKRAESFGNATPVMLPVELLGAPPQNEKMVSAAYATIPTTRGDFVLHPRRLTPTKAALNNTRFALFGPGKRPTGLGATNPVYRLLGGDIRYHGFSDPSTFSPAVVDTTPRAFAGNMLGHEFDHNSAFGHTPGGLSIRWNGRGGAVGIQAPGGTPELVGFTTRYSMTPRREQPDMHPEVFATTVGRGLDQAHRSWNDFYRLPTELQDKYGLSLTPYATRDIELTQSISSYNRNRNNLRNNIRNNRAAYINAGFTDAELDRIMSQQQFYKADSEGRDSFVRDAEFFRGNPHLTELLGSEGGRFIYYWDDINKGINKVSEQIPDLNSRNNNSDRLKTINDYVESSGVKSKLEDLRDRVIKFRILGNRSNSTGVPSNVTYPRSNSRTTVG